MNTDYDLVDDCKVLIVEGKTDKDRLLQVLNEPVEIVCTQGSLSYEKLEELLAFAQNDVYILVDADEPGNKLRLQLKRELPNAVHLYTRKKYREVAATPLPFLAKLLSDAHFTIDERWLVDEGEMAMRRADRLKATDRLKDRL